MERCEKEKEILFVQDYGKDVESIREKYGNDMEKMWKRCGKGVDNLWKGRIRRRTGERMWKEIGKDVERLLEDSRKAKERL